MSTYEKFKSEMNAQFEAGVSGTDDFTDGIASAFRSNAEALDVFSGISYEAAATVAPESREFTEAELLEMLRDLPKLSDEHSFDSQRESVFRAIRQLVVDVTREKLEEEWADKLGISASSPEHVYDGSAPFSEEYPVGSRGPKP